MSWSDERWNIGWIEIVSGQPEGGSGMAKHTHCAPESRENAKESCDMWYVIQTQTGREQELTECIERVLKGNGYRACFVIEQECVWRNAGELLEYQKPLFPSYVIADTNTPEEFFLALKRVPKLSKLLRTDCEFWAIREEEKKLLCQMMELDEQSVAVSPLSTLVRRSLVTLDKEGNILNAKAPLSFFQDKIVRKRIRKRIVTVEVELLGEKRRIELGFRLPEDN